MKGKDLKWVTGTTDGFQLLSHPTESGEKMLGRIPGSAKTHPVPEHQWNTSSGQRVFFIVLIHIHCYVDLDATA